MWLQNGRRGNCAKLVAVGMDRKSCLYTSYTEIHSVLAQLSAHTTGKAVCIWPNSLVFHFAGSSIYNSFIYGVPDEENAWEGGGQIYIKIASKSPIWDTVFGVINRNQTHDLLIILSAQSQSHILQYIGIRINNVFTGFRQEQTIYRVPTYVI